MVKKKIYGAADPKMRKSILIKNQNKQPYDFNWEFYKNTAKIKIKQLE